MVYILKGKQGKTLQQSYDGIGFVNSSGHAECVEFIRQTLGAPPTDSWREGKKVTQGDLTILPGTPIATFINGKYPQAGATGKHAAIYLGQNAQGIQVLDQWRSQGVVKPRTIKWHPTDHSLSDNGNAFSVVEW